MGFMDAVKKCFQNYVNFSGRARRAEYWYFMLFNFLISFGLSILGTLAGQDSFLGTVFNGIASLYSLAVFIPGLAVAWRRLHDIGKSSRPSAPSSRRTGRWGDDDRRNMERGPNMGPLAAFFNEDYSALGSGP